VRAAAAVVALGLLFAVAPAAQAAAPLEVHATLDRGSVGLGDPFVYTVEARAPATGTLRVAAGTGPFTLIAPPRTSRRVSGGVAVVRVEQTLICVDRACSPGAQPRRVLLPPARAWSGGRSSAARTPSVTLTPRVPASAVAASRAAYRRQTAVPPPSTPIPLAAAAAILGIAAAVLVAAGLLLALRELRPARAHTAQGRVAGMLEQALRLLRESAARPAPDRRRAADYAARAAARDAALEGGSQVVDEARHVAWAPPDPEAADVGTLAEHIETALRAGR
jgi:hypothetical protein